MVILLPLVVLWAIFALVYMFFRQKQASARTWRMLEQLKKASDTTNALAYAMFNAETETKNAVILHEFDTLTADINELLSDIIKRSNSISSAQIEHLWSRTAGGERWIIAKSFIETSCFQPDFAAHLLQKAKKDPLLKEGILEFLTRYKNLHALLEMSDRQKNLLNIIEHGALEKVYRILLPLPQEFNNEHVASVPKIRQPAPLPKKEFSLTEEPAAFPSFLSAKETPAAPAAPVSSNSAVEIGLTAIRNELLSPKKEPAFEEIRPAPSVTADFSVSRPTVKKIKQSPKSEEKQKKPVISLDELEKEINASPDNNYDEYAYPFGAWINDKNK